MINILYWVASFVTTLVSASTAVIIFSISRSEVRANVTSSSFATITALLGGTFIAIDAMPPLLRLFSVLSPSRWIVELLRVV